MDDDKQECREWVHNIKTWLNTHKTMWMKQYLTGRSKKIIIPGNQCSKTHFNGEYHTYRSGRHESVLHSTQCLRANIGAQLSKIYPFEIKVNHDLSWSSEIICVATSKRLQDFTHEHFSLELTLQ